MAAADVVVDASVAVKWFFPTPEDPAEDAAAQTLLEAAVDGAWRLVQPPHWHAEVAAVLARVHPTTAPDNVDDLLRLACVEVAATQATWLRATELAVALRHHLFDTLYHALAIERQCTFVTADMRYWRKAHALGAIVPLRDWAPG